MCGEGDRMEKDAGAIAEDDEKPMRKSVLERFGRDHLGKS
jgi:hypothetical protein